MPGKRMPEMRVLKGKNIRDKRPEHEQERESNKKIEDKPMEGYRYEPF